MKANQKFRDNNQAASSVVGTVLLLPIAMAIITAILLWSGELTYQIRQTENDIRQDWYTFKNTNFTVLQENQNKLWKTIWEDDFEEQELTWYIKKSNVAGCKLNAFHEDHFYTKGHSARLKIPKTSVDPNYICLSHYFHGEAYDKISIEIAFTIDLAESEKIFTLYQNSSEKNNATIKIIAIDADSELYKIDCYTKYGISTIADQVKLNADPHCWHHIQIIINYETETSNEPHYEKLILDNKEYPAISNKILKNNHQKTTQNPEFLKFKYTTNNNYDIQLNSMSYIDDFKIKKPIKKQITTPSVNIPPIASFTYNPINPNPGDNVQFTDTSIDDGTIVSWSWEFGDGNTDNVQNPIHTYIASGSYTVNLTVTDNQGDTDTAQNIIHIGVCFSFDKSAYRLREHEGPLTIVVNLSSPAGPSGASVDYNVIGGTATLGNDFTVGGSGTLNFPSGSSSESFTVTIIDDSDIEDLDETAIFEISNPVNGVIGIPSQTTLTIRDNDGYAIRFDGFDDFLEAADDASLDITEEYTIEAWVKPDDIGAEPCFHGILTKRATSGQDPYQLGVNNWQTSIVSFCYDDDDDMVMNFGFPVVLNDWNHIAITREYDYSLGFGHMKSYINGVLVEEGHAGQDQNLKTTDGTLRIGNRTTHICDAFEGILDEVRIYGNALSESKINDHYHGNYLTDPSNDSRAVWHFNEGAGNTAFDSKNSNDALLNNGPIWTNDIPEIPWY